MSSQTLRRPKAAPARASRPRVGAGQVLTQIILWSYAVIAFGPIILIVIGSLRPTNEILQRPLGLPHSFDLSNYVNAWIDGSMGTYFVNSALVTVSAVILNVAISTPLAHALARWPFRGRAALSGLVVAGLIIPAKVGLLPLFHLFQALGLIDNLIGLVILYAAESVPFSVFLLVSYIRGIPEELEEAGKLDGANDGRIFLSIMLPQMRPGLVLAAVFCFAPTWNDFFYPLVLLRNQDKYTVPVGLSSFFGQYSTDYGVLYSAVIIAIIPAIIIFALLSRQIVSGLAAGIGR